MNHKYLILYNPVSCNGKSSKIVEKLKLDFDKLKYSYKYIQTQYPGHMTELCEKNQSYNQVIIIGGDGTFNEAVNGIMLNPLADQQVFGFLPGGTGNSFLYDLGGEKYSKAIEIIKKGQIKNIDILKLNLKKSVKYSINIVGWGLVSDVNIMSEKLRFFGSARYNIASAYYIFNKKHRYATIEIDGRKIEDNFLFLLCSNTIHTGKGMKAAPHAKLDDGLLDVTIVKSNIPTTSLISLLLKIFSGKHIYSKYVEYQQVETVKIYPSKNEMLNIDGENKWSTPVVISVIPKKLSIYA